MPSAVHRKSYGSVKVVWLDRDRLVRDITSAVRTLAEAHPEVSRAILFGSAASGRATPKSDVDLVLVVDDTDERFIERPGKYLPSFDGLGLGVDIVVYTAQEAAAGNISLLGVAERTGRIVFERR
jgi:predicted nucleotidyltransferase